MTGRWNHAKRPSEYEVYDEKKQLIFSGSFNEAMKYINQDAEIDIFSFQKGYEKGYKEGANKQNNKSCVCGFWGDK